MKNECSSMMLELPGLANGTLKPVDAGTVRLHLSGCPSCRSELAQIESLDRLLRKAMPTVELSPGFASTFANRLAAEIAAQEDAEERGVLGWLLQPWLVPVAAASMLVIVMLGTLRFSPWSSEGPLPNLPTTSSPVAKRPVAEAPRLAAGSGEQKTKEVASTPPQDVLQRPELFVDYSVIRDLDILESGKGDTESHTG